MQPKFKHFLLKGGSLEKTELGPCFQQSGFGPYVLERKKVVNAVFNAIENQLKLDKQSTGVYLSGCRGMGKTCDLRLIAEEFNAEGWEVYWFESASLITPGDGLEIRSYAKQNRQKKIAVIVDEVAANAGSDLFVSLLKDAPPNIATIGAAVPRYLPTGSTAQFKCVLTGLDLSLSEDDEDVRALIEHWKSSTKEVITADMVEYVSKFLLNYCGGHVFPVLALMEHFFTNGQAQRLLVDRQTFIKHFLSAEFTKSETYRRICGRCFDAELDSSILEVLARVVENTAGASGDVDRLTRVGWWNPKKLSVVSTLLLNEGLRRSVSASSEHATYLDPNSTPEENVEKLIIEGLYYMEPSELKSISSTSGWPIENALSFNWARSVLSRFRNVHMEFQAPTNGKWMDFYVNGVVNCGVEIIRNATRTVSEGAEGGSADIDSHLNRFLSGEYAVSRFVIFNFNLKNEVLVLPKNTKFENHVYTYMHTTNTLFRGRRAIRAPAVGKLECRLPLSGSRMGFCTVAVKRFWAGTYGHLSLTPRGLVTLCKKII